VVRRVIDPRLQLLDNPIPDLGGVTVVQAD
jgi:hypothetical protein